MRTAITVPPLQWLSTPPGVVARPQEVLATFADPGAAAVVRFHGGERFYRAAGLKGNGALASAYGQWWVHQSVLAAIRARLEQFEGWLPASMLRDAVPARYRALAAICRDWNDLSEVVCLEVPADKAIEALAGTTAPQPIDAARRHDPNVATLPGGAEQCFIKAVNPLWVYYGASLA